MKLIFLLSIISSVASTDPCSSIYILRRGTVFELPEVIHAKPTANKVFFTQTGNETCDNVEDCFKRVLRLRSDALANHYSDIQDNFLIGNDNIVYSGLGWKANNFRYDDYPNQLSVSFIGDFREKTLPKNMASVAKNLLLCGIQQGYLSEEYSVYSSYDLTCKREPNGIDEEIQKWSAYGLHGPLISC